MESNGMTGGACCASADGAKIANNATNNFFTAISPFAGNYTGTGAGRNPPSLPVSPPGVTLPDQEEAHHGEAHRVRGQRGGADGRNRRPRYAAAVCPAQRA